MNYDTAFERLEEVIRSMHKDVEKYAARDDASERAVNAKVALINKIIEFLNIADDEITELRWALLQEQTKFNRLHADTQKLVLWCELHQVSANMIFHYSKEELQKMKAEGVRIVPPVKNFDTLVYALNGETLSCKDIDEEIKLHGSPNSYSRKYDTLKLLLTH